MVSILFIPLSELFGEAIYDLPFVFERAYLTFLGIIGTTLFAWNILHYKKFTAVEIFYILLLVLAALSISNSNPTKQIPLFIISGHIEELFHYYAYFFLFYCSTKINLQKDAKYIFWAIIAVGILHDSVGIFQLFGLRISHSYNNVEMHEELRCIYGLTSNCNFYAAIGTLFTALACCYYYVSESKYNNIKFIILILISSFCTIGSGTRLGLVGVISTCIFITIIHTFLVITNRTEKSYYLSTLKYSNFTDITAKLSVIFITVLFSLIIMYFTFPQLLKPSIGEFVADFLNIAESSSGNTEALDQIGSFRGQVWRFVYEYLININFLTGTGIGNFSDIFFTNPRIHESPQIVNYAHNEYLHIFATQGIFAFLTYMTLYFVCISRLINSIIMSRELTYTKNGIIIFIMIFSYMSQAFFNCNIFETYFYFWILLGLAYSHEHQK